MSNSTLILLCTHCIIIGPDQYYLNDGSCVITCPDGRYKGINGSEPTCLICSSNCNTCVTTNTYCTSCGLIGGLQSYIYSDNKCYVTCPANTYAEISTTSCVNCHTSCSGCFQSQVNCINCAGGYYRIIGSKSCTQTCSQGQYADSTSSSCTVCPLGCYTCSSGTSCSLCMSVAGVQYYL
jgi:proprotein convertase subtilisin/kexin type 5